MYNVLIVDDEPTIREGLKTVIPWEKHGFRIADLAINGKDALNKYRLTSPQLMIVDLRMPGIDGLKLIETIRQTDSTVHFLILSGYADFQYARKAIHHSVDEYMLKPIDELELIDYLQRLHMTLDQEATMNQLVQDYSDQGRDAFVNSLLTGESLEQSAEKLYMALTSGCEQTVERTVINFGERLQRQSCLDHAFKTNFTQYVTLAWNKWSTNPSGTVKNSVQPTQAIMGIYKQPDESAVIRYVMQLLREYIAPATNDDAKTVIHKILELIQHNYNDNLKLETLAELFNYNSAYLGKVFKSHTGEYFRTYLDQVRIAKAKELLGQDLKLYEIAECVGYTNVDYFHSKFRKYVGISPTHYRKNHL